MRLSCCGNFYNSNGVTWEKVSRYVTDRKNFIKPYVDGKRTKSETIYVAVCENCGHYIVAVVRQIENSKPIIDRYKGKAGDEFFYSNYKKFIEKPLPCPYAEIKHKKTIPFIYGKTLDKTTQIPRYLDESGNAGGILEFSFLSFFI